VKYGHALSRWFPALVATHGWSLRASVLLSGETLRLDLDAASPVPRTHSMARPHDSRLEATLERELRRLATDWRVEREVAAVRVVTPHRGRPKLLFPDFALASARGRVLVEVVGYWTRDYLDGKRAMMQAVRAPLVLCVDERHADADLAKDPRVIVFKKRIDARALLDACARELARHAPVAPAPPGSASQ
jgi:uncharacterized protein